jgi:hypothetical protein
MPVLLVCPVRDRQECLSSCLKKVQARRPHYNLDIFHWGVVGVVGLRIIKNRYISADLFHGRYPA